MKNTTNQNYETTDIALASYLFCSSVELISINHNNPRRCVFVFTMPDPELLSKWHSGKAEVNALAYHNAYQALKTKVYEEK